MTILGSGQRDNPSGVNNESRDLGEGGCKRRVML